MGRLSNRIGDFVEEMVAPAAGRLFAGRGIPVHLVARNVRADRDGRAAEFDMLVVNDNHLVAIEVKSRPKIDDINEHLERLAILKQLIPTYRSSHVHGAIAGMTWDEETARYAYRQGLFVLGQSGDTITILNDEKFRPRVW
jgi:predicted AAA+ superfamily ATPase